MLLGLWLILAGKVSGLELLAGVVVAVVGTVIWAQALPPLGSRQPVVRLWRVAWRILADAWAVTRMVARRLAGRPVDSGLRLVHFDPGADSATGAARRAMAVAAVSVSANSYVIDVDTERGTLLLHQLDRGAPGAADPRVIR
jgi:multisubunit Na+/H+ antiporter MnhE subunit